VKLDAGEVGVPFYNFQAVESIMQRRAIISLVLILVFFAVTDGTPIKLQNLNSPAQAVEVVAQVGHVHQVSFARFSPNGQQALTGSWDNTVRLWDLRTGREVRRFEGHQDNVVSACFSADGQRVLTASWDGTARLWDTQSGKQLSIFDCGGFRIVPARIISGGDWVRHSFDRQKVWVTSASFSPVGDYILTSSFDGTNRLWDGKTGEEIRRFVITASLLDAQLGAAGPVLLSPEEMRRRALADASAATGAAFSPDGRQVASITRGGEIILWDTANGQEIRRFRNGKAILQSVAFAPDGTTLLTTDRTGAVIRWDPLTGNRRLSIDIGYRVNSGVFSKDGSRILLSNENNVAQIRDAASGALIKAFRGHTDAVNYADLSADGAWILTAGSDGTARLWAAGSGKEVMRLEGYANRGLLARFYKNGMGVLTATQDGIVRLWNLLTGSLEKSFGPQAQLVAADLSPDGTTVVLASRDGKMRLFNVATGRELQHFDVGEAGFSQAAFAIDSRHILTVPMIGTDILLWNTDDPGKPQHFPGHEAAAVSKDGRFIVTASGNSAALYHIEGGEAIHRFLHSNTVNSVCFSNDGSLIATASADKTVGIWEVKTGTEKRLIRGHHDSVAIAAFSPDQKAILTGSTDNMAVLWDLGTTDRLADFSKHSYGVRSVDFSPDGQRALTTGGDGATTLWDVKERAEIATLISVGREDYIIYTPAGFYHCSRDGHRGVAFRIQNASYPFEQFDLRLNRPDLVLQRLGSKDQQLINAFHAAYMKRLEKMGVIAQTATDGFHVPRLSIDADKLPFSVTDNILTFKIQAIESDRQRRLEAINVWVNDVPANGAVNGQPFRGVNGFNLQGKNLNSLEADLTVNLSRGPNKIQVSCLNSDHVESLRQTFYITYTAAPPVPKPDLYVLTVGVTHYRQSENDLTFAANDAEKIGAFFNRPNRRYGQKHIICLTDRDATRENIIATARRWFSRAKVDDEVILFMAGHGLLNNQLNYYFAPHDMEFTNPQQYGLAYEAIEGLLDGIQPRKKLLLLDTCHAGEVDKAMTATLTNPQGLAAGVKAVAVRARLGKSYVGLGNSFLLMQNLFADLRRGSGAAVIAAASGVQYAYEADGNGLFTHALLEGLDRRKADPHRKADRNNDGKVTVSELSVWAFQRVYEMTGGKQVPTVRRENIEFDWVIR